MNSLEITNTDLVEVRNQQVVTDSRKVAEVFGGGGHTKAAGGMIKDISLINAEEELLKELKKELADKNLL